MEDSTQCNVRVWRLYVVFLNGLDPSLGLKVSKEVLKNSERTWLCAVSRGHLSRYIGTCCILKPVNECVPFGWLLTSVLSATKGMLYCRRGLSEASTAHLYTAGHMQNCKTGRTAIPGAPKKAKRSPCSTYRNLQLSELYSIKLLDPFGWPKTSKVRSIHTLHAIPSAAY